MYYYAWHEAPLPGGSYATHSAHAVFHSVFVGVTSVDLLLQAYTVYLMLRVARDQLSEYRYFMMLSTTWDVCLATTLGFLVQPHVHGPMFPCISARGPVAAFGHEGARISMILVYTFAVALVASQIYCMIYRVMSVLENQVVKRRFLSSPVITFFILFQAGATAGISYAVHLTTMRDTNEQFDGHDLATEWVLNSAGQKVWIQRLIWHAFLLKLREYEYTTDEDTSVMCFNTTDWGSMYIQGSIMALFAIVQLATSAAAVWIIRKVGRMASNSTRTHKMHLQLTRLLLLQMLNPVICVMGPLMSFVGSILNLYIHSIVTFYMGLLAISIFPMINALLTITFVGPYRRFTVAWIEAAYKADLRPSGGDGPSAASSSNAQRTVRAPERRRNTMFGTGVNRIAPHING